MSFVRDEIENLEQNGITRVALARLGDPSVIPLWFGEGDAVTARFIRDAAKRALDDGETFYTHTRGTGDLRAAIKRYLDRLYRIDLDPDRITVPGAAMMGVTIASQMALSSGSHGLMVGPVWPNIENCFQVTGADYDSVRLREESRDGRIDWRLDLDDLRAAIRPKTRALFLNSPSNPTGWIMPREQQREVLALCRDRDILLIADEVYHRAVYVGEAAPSFLEIAQPDDPLVVVNGFSKAWAMTGWRLGWMVHPPRYADTLAILSECFNTGATVFTQAAGVVALDEGEPEIRRLREQYERGRALCMEILGAHPRVEMAEPEGGFYVFARVRGLTSSLEFVEGVLAEEDVGIAPGYTFGPGNEAYFRVCFAASHERLAQGLRRIVRYLDRHDNEFTG